MRRPAQRITPYTLLLLVSVTLGSDICGAQEPRSSVTVLVDLSATWLNEDQRNLNRDVLRTVAEGVVLTSKRYMSPTVVRFLPIGDISLFRAPLCEGIFSPKLLKRRSNPPYFHSRREFEQYLVEDCPEFILSRKPQQFTDIQGALDSVRRFTKMQEGVEKAIVVLSDMKEELRDKQKEMTLNLAGFRVLLVVRILEKDRLSPEAFDTRIREWEQRLTASGAVVHSLADRALTGGQIERLLVE